MLVTYLGKVIDTLEFKFTVGYYSSRKFSTKKDKEELYYLNNFL